MKLLGLQPTAGLPLPEPPAARDARPGLLLEDPEGYARLVRHLCGGERRLEAWVEPLASGRARVILTGQQPALLGGPLYTLYKTATAIAAARRMRRQGLGAVAAFYCVGDDTDYDEVASIAWPVPGRAPARVKDEPGHSGERIGSLSAQRMRPALERLRGDWPAAEALLGRLEGMLADPAVRDWSDFLRSLLASLFPDEPLVFIDGNDPFVIEAVQPWLRRIVSMREEISARLDSEAERLRANGIEPSLSAAEGRRALFLLEGESRRALEPEEAPPEGSLLLPNVVVRPAMQEFLLPVERVVCGEGEIRYRSQLGPIHEMLGAPAAPLMRRFAATLFPRPWGVEAGMAEAQSAVADPDAFLETWARRRRDRAVQDRIDESMGELRTGLERLRSALSGLDRGLDEIAASAAGKIDFQLKRIEEAMISKSRSLLYRSFPDLAQLRELLLPRGRPQERVFSLLTPALWERDTGMRSLESVVDLWLERGSVEHALIAMGSEEEQ